MSPAASSMRVAVTGASGLLGTAITARLRELGHEITPVVRSRDAAARQGSVYWSPDRGEMDGAGLTGHQAVVNLAGENIFGIWTPAKRERIRRSRVDGVALLARTLAGLDSEHRPETLILASAVGYYGDRPWDQPLTEADPPGDSFLARVIVDMEAAAAPAVDAGIRVVKLRFAPVLDPEATLLRGMSQATRLGLGAALGPGDQPFPWVTRDDIARLVPFVLEREDLEGPVNVAAPEKVSNAEFADAVARVLNRPRLLRVPTPAIRLLGDFGDEMLVGQWVVPARLEAAGYPWHDPKLEPALRRMLTTG